MAPLENFAKGTAIWRPVLIGMDVACGATCFACWLQAVPKKKGDSGKKVLAKILGQILNGAKKAEKVTKSWWEIFSVSTFPCWLFPVEWAEVAVVRFARLPVMTCDKFMLMRTAVSWMLQK